jgi:hypothetical protein
MFLEKTENEMYACSKLNKGQSALSGTESTDPGHVTNHVLK